MNLALHSLWDRIGTPTSSVEQDVGVRLSKHRQRRSTMMRWLQFLRQRAVSSWLAGAVLAWACVGMAGASPWRAVVADSWTIACVECPRSFDALTDRSLRLLPDGRPAAAYGGDHLYYAWRADVGWQVQVVDEAPAVGGSASLAVSAAGRPHIAYAHV